MTVTMIIFRCFRKTFEENPEGNEEGAVPIVDYDRNSLYLHGFNNNENNCYRNAVIQGLFSISKLNNMTIEILKSPLRSVLLYDEFSVLWSFFRMIHHNHLSTPDPRRQKGLVRNYMNQFWEHIWQYEDSRVMFENASMNKHGQQDPHEFYLLIMSYFNKKIKLLRAVEVNEYHYNRDPIYDLFRIGLTHEIECHRGHLRSSREDLFSLMLNIQDFDADLNDCIRSYFDTEYFDEKDNIQCPTCQTQVILYIIFMKKRSE